jgi:hypothetical protein
MAEDIDAQAEEIAANLRREFGWTRAFAANGIQVYEGTAAYDPKRKKRNKVAKLQRKRNRG